MSYLKQKVSVFSSYRDVKPKDVVLLDFLTSTKYKSEVLKIRSANDKSIINALKSKLPAVTPSGLFENKRSIANLKRHSGLMQIDIDKQDNMQLDMMETKDLLKSIDQICYVSYSVSGKGLFALIPIAEPQKHKAHFMALEQDFKADFNIVIDKSCKDVSRLRGYSYDADFYINENAKVYTEILEQKPKQKPMKIIKSNIIAPINKEDNFYNALKIIEAKHIDITGSNEQWFTILCAIANEFGEAGRNFAHLISQYSLMYDSNRCDKDYSRALKSNYGYNLGTFYYYLKTAI